MGTYFCLIHRSFQSNDRSNFLDMCGLAQISLGSTRTDLPRVECLFVCHHSSAFYSNFVGTIDMAFRCKALVAGVSSVCLLVIASFAFLYFDSNSPGADCIALLEQEGYEFTALGGFDEGQCQIDIPVRITSLPKTSINKPITLSCPFALKVGEWSEEVGAKRLNHVGGYNCRKIAGSFLMSQHSYGNAIDVVSVNGKDLSQNYKELSAVACKYFTNVFGPADDAAHAHHIHLDNGPGIGCGPRKFLKSFLN